MCALLQHLQRCAHLTRPPPQHGLGRARFVVSLIYQVIKSSNSGICFIIQHWFRHVTSAGDFLISLQEKNIPWARIFSSDLQSLLNWLSAGRVRRKYFFSKLLGWNYFDQRQEIVGFESSYCVTSQDEPPLIWMNSLVIHYIQQLRRWVIIPWRFIRK